MKDRNADQVMLRWGHWQEGEGKGGWVWLMYFLYFLLLCWVGVHCGIYKSSYNISNISHLNSPPPLFFFISSPLIDVFSRHVWIWKIEICQSYLERGGGRGRIMEGMNQTEVHYIQIWKCHNETPCTTIIN
jgi:hypothetical protein